MQYKVHTHWSLGKHLTGQIGTPVKEFYFYRTKYIVLDIAPNLCFMERDLKKV